MRLSSLIQNLPDHLAPIDEGGLETSDPVIRGIGYDSRRISPGDLFVALPGSVQDGHDYIERAVELGAVAVLVERPARELP
ncbi:MAG: Mur ligase domain-containing protein, partial [Myxococcota bacterium]